MTIRRVFCAECSESERIATENHCAVFCVQCGRVRFPNVSLALGTEEQRLQRREERNARLSRIDRPTALDRASSLPDRTVAFVLEALVWEVKKARLERSSSLRSTFTGVLTAAELGIVGSGCSSSVGPYSAAATRGEQLPMLDARLVAEGDARYAGLAPAERETVSVLTDDEHGPSDFAVILAPGQPARTLSLATRVGLQLASAGVRRDWYRKIVARDSRGPLLGANELGTKRLNAGAAAWFGADAFAHEARSAAQNAGV